MQTELYWKILGILFSCLVTLVTSFRLHCLHCIPQPNRIIFFCKQPSPSLYSGTFYRFRFKIFFFQRNVFFFLFLNGPKWQYVDKFGYGTSGYFDIVVFIASLVPSCCRCFYCCCCCCCFRWTSILQTTREPLLGRHSAGQSTGHTHLRPILTAYRTCCSLICT